MILRVLWRMEDGQLGMMNKEMKSHCQKETVNSLPKKMTNNLMRVNNLMIKRVTTVSKMMMMIHKMKTKI